MDGSLKQCSKHVIVGISLSFGRMTKDCLSPKRAKGKKMSRMTLYLLNNGFSGTNFQPLERTEISASDNGRSSGMQ